MTLKGKRHFTAQLQKYLLEIGSTFTTKTPITRTIITIITSGR